MRSGWILEFPTTQPNLLHGSVFISTASTPCVLVADGFASVGCESFPHFSAGRPRKRAGTAPTPSSFDPRRAARACRCRTSCCDVDRRGPCARRRRPARPRPSRRRGRGGSSVAAPTAPARSSSDAAACATSRCASRAAPSSMARDRAGPSRTVRLRDDVVLQRAIVLDGRRRRRSAVRGRTGGGVNASVDGHRHRPER